MERTKVILGHLSAGPLKQVELRQTSAGMSCSFRDRDEDIVVVSAKRTPLCKAKRGQFKVFIVNFILSFLYPTLYWS